METLASARNSPRQDMITYTKTPSTHINKQTQQHDNTYTQNTTYNQQHQAKQDMSTYTRARTCAVYTLRWLPRPFRPFSISRFAVSPFYRFGIMFVLFHFLLSALPF